MKSKKPSSPEKLSDEINRLKAQLKEKEKQLNAAGSEIEKYRKLLESATDWIYWIGPTGQIHYVSPSCKAITGYNPQEFIEQPDLILKIVHPDDRLNTEKQIKKEFNQHKLCSNQFRIRTKDGETRWIWHQCNPVYDQTGQMIGRRVSNRDITELKAVKNTLEENRHLLRMVFDGMPDPVHMINRNFEIELTNRQLLDLKGLEEGLIKGKHCFEIYQGRNEKCTPCAAVESFETGRTTSIKKTLPLPDGSKKYFEVFAYPVKDESGEISHVIELTRDITEQKRLEEELRQSLDQYLQLASAIPLGVLSCDCEGTITFVNKAMLEILGSPTPQETMRFNVLQFPPLEKIGITQKLRETLKTGKRFLFQTEYTSVWNKKSVLRIHIDPIRKPDGAIGGALGLIEDFTAYTQLQHEVVKSEQKFRNIFENSPNGIIIFNNDFKISDVNHGTEQITRYRKEELIGKYIWEVANAWVPETTQNRTNFQQFLKDHVKRLETGAPSVQFETLLQDKEGRTHYLEELLFKIQTNKSSFFVNIKTDITDRYESQRALKDSEKRYKEMYRLFRLIADNDPDMLWAKDLKGRFIFTNKTICERLLGAKDVYEPIGKDDLFFARRLRQKHPENPKWHNFGEACLDSDKITLQEKKPMHFEEYGNVMGKFMFLDVHKAPLRDEQGHIIGTVGSARDITEQKAMEQEKEAIQNDLARLAAVIEQTDIAVLITDINGTIQYVNRAFEVDSGYSKEEAIGQNPRILKSGEHPAEFFKEMWDTVLAGKTWHNTIINRKKDGTLYHEDAIIFPLFDSNGQITNFAGILRDISKEIELEKQVRQMQKMESIGILTGGIAHDFNNLLTVINGYTDLGLKKYGSDSKIRSILTAIQSAGNRAAELTSQLLAFSRKQIISPKILDINETILSLEKMLRRIIEEHIELELFLKPDLPKIKADPVQIEQILMNLVVNARDALHSASSNSNAGKRIQIETSLVYLGPEYMSKHKGVKEGDYICLSVSDNGIGMDEGTLNKIFDPFFTTKEVGKGTGLGLSTVYGIVKQNNGNVFAYSEPGKGTTVKIYWPVCTEQKTKNKEPADLNLSDLNGDEIILLVEDDPYVQQVGRDALKEFGYQVITASSGPDALKKIEKENIKPHLLITDLVMPQMSGKTLASKLKKMIPNLKVIYASGYTKNLILKNGVLDKGIHFIQKPYQITHFIRIVRTVLDE